MLEIEIVESNIIDGGVEVFARAWRDGKQIGFGKDGSVDIERFRFINPPVLVEDKNGDIVEEYVCEITGEKIVTKFREDPEEAILDSLTHVISKVGKDGMKIEENKVGNTTTTIYATTDVRLRIENNTSMTWAQARGATSADTVDVDQSSNAGPYTEYSPASPTNKHRLARHFYSFDTSAIGTDDITSATLSVYVNAVPWNQFLGSDNFASVIQHNSASDTSWVAGDVDNIYNSDGTTPLDGSKVMKELCDTGERRSFSVTTTGMNDYVLNTGGIAVINKTGYSKLGLAIGKDILNNAPSGGSYKLEGLQYRGVGYSGTSSDPKLVIEHSAGGGATANNSARRQHFMMM